MIKQNEFIIEMRGIDKSFNGIPALEKVDFLVRTGEIHGLVGENGAGKTTLVKILAGIYQKDKGDIRIRENLLGKITPAIIEDLGIQFIHQDRYLVPTFTVAQSVFLGHELTVGKTFLLDSKKMQKACEEFLKNVLDVNIPANSLIRDLTVAQAQIVQIAKALMYEPAIIVFDEPTAPLSRKDVHQLFKIIKRMKSQGITIIYISHYLQEIFEICDRVTVLRNGLNAGDVIPKERTIDDIVKLMVGRELSEMFPFRKSNIQDPILLVKELSRREEYKDISFEIHRGEVLGLVGLIGSGKESLVDALFGLKQPDSGDIVFKGKNQTKLSPVSAVIKGIALVPRDRRAIGLVMDLEVGENLNLSSLLSISKFGFIQQRFARKRNQEMISNLDIRTPNADMIVRYLSGGNQQKVVIGRWLLNNASLYILDDPTVGVDVGAKIEIYNLINQLTTQGVGVLMISSDIPELIGMSDRIIVMYRGQVVKELISKKTSADEVLAWATGGQSAQ